MAKKVNFKLFLAFIFGILFMIIAAVIADFITQKGPSPGAQDRDGSEGKVVYQTALSSLNTLDRDRLKEKAWLGAEVQLNLSGTGVLVNKVVEGSPAHKNGLERGDVIIKFDRRDVEDVSTLQTLISNTSPGERVKLEVIRDNSHKSLYVKMGSLSAGSVAGIASTLISQVALEERSQERDSWGITVASLNAVLAYHFGIPDKEKGIVVVGVTSNSKAERAGLREGDLIRSINRTTTADLNSFFAALSKNTGTARQTTGGQAVLDVFRQGEELYVFIEPIGKAQYILAATSDPVLQEKSSGINRPTTVPSTDDEGKEPSTNRPTFVPGYDNSQSGRTDTDNTGRTNNDDPVLQEKSSGINRPTTVPSTDDEGKEPSTNRPTFVPGYDNSQSGRTDTDNTGRTNNDDLGKYKGGKIF